MKEWIDYLTLEEGKHVFGEDGGLIAFNVEKKECHITDFYVRPDLRKTGLALELAQRAETAAVEQFGCNVLTCNVFINRQNRKSFAYKVKIFSKFGFLPLSASHNVVTMIKEL